MSLAWCVCWGRGDLQAIIRDDDLLLSCSELNALLAASQATATGFLALAVFYSPVGNEEESFGASLEVLGFTDQLAQRPRLVVQVRSQTAANGRAPRAGGGVDGGDLRAMILSFPLLLLVGSPSLWTVLRKWVRYRHALRPAVAVWPCA